ncbi:MAG TPA: histidine phosphatase family protein [Dermatophilaceae bacterium]|jgi:phosphohistidine phosphatase|nr:histidine phosphatase family protein [Actinomycetales bacterium]HMT32799.1 histidine phosphatase family protein [Dermatophilaceae bacterium]HMT91202.1 histidine phosphatase family protein [Dermatophilaceae bacterium]
MSEPSRRLLLLRHSKAEHVFGKADHERELTDRGHADARAIGEWLAAQGIEPDLVICSTATRTRQTWASAQEGGARADATAFEKGIYHGGVRAVMTAAQEADPDLTTLLVVGHEPTMSAATEILTEGAGAAAALAASDRGFPTSGLAVLAVDGPWARLAQGGATLEEFVVGRG